MRENVRRPRTHTLRTLIYIACVFAQRFRAIYSGEISLNNLGRSKFCGKASNENTLRFSGGNNGATSASLFDRAKHGYHEKRQTCDGDSGYSNNRSSLELHAESPLYSAGVREAAARIQCVHA